MTFRPWDVKQDHHSYFVSHSFATLRIARTPASRVHLSYYTFILLTISQNEGGSTLGCAISQLVFATNNVSKTTGSTPCPFSLPRLQLIENFATDDPDGESQRVLHKLSSEFTPRFRGNRLLNDGQTSVRLVLTVSCLMTGPPSRVYAPSLHISTHNLQC